MLILTVFALLCYVMWNLCNVDSLQFCNDSTITSLEANQNRPCGGCSTLKRSIHHNVASKDFSDPSLHIIS